jgi:hypothetical protein
MLMHFIFLGMLHTQLFNKYFAVFCKKTGFMKL